MLPIEPSPQEMSSHLHHYHHHHYNHPSQQTSSQPSCSSSRNLKKSIKIVDIPLVYSTGASMGARCGDNSAHDTDLMTTTTAAANNNNNTTATTTMNTNTTTTTCCVHLECGDSNNKSHSLTGSQCLLDQDDLIKSNDEFWTTGVAYKSHAHKIFSHDGLNGKTDTTGNNTSENSSSSSQAAQIQDIAPKIADFGFKPIGREGVENENENDDNDVFPEIAKIDEALEEKEAPKVS